MEPLTFLSVVLPTTGKLCVAVIDPPIKQQFFVDSYEEFHKTTDLQDGVGRTTYMALASFDNSKSREAIHALYMRSLFIDLDCGIDKKNNKPKAFPSKRTAVAALGAFLQKTGLDKLGRPWLVDSGNGVHVYWPLSKDVPVAGWKVVAEALKKTAFAEGFKIDYGVTADAARVLRMPGTHNRKYGDEKEVLLRQQGDVFELHEIAACLAPITTATTVIGRPGQVPALILPGKPLNVATSKTALVLAANSVTYFKNILVRTAAGTGCGQVNYYTNNAAQDGMEPLWRGLLSLAKPCEDGLKAARVLSAMHPYTEDRMQTKLAEIKGPYPCTKLDSENPGICTTCSHWGRITNPLALGRSTDLVVEETEVEFEADGQLHRGQRPAAPRGFSFGRNGGVYYTETEIDAKTSDKTTREIMLLPFDFYRLDTLVEDGVYMTRFMAIREGRRQIIVIPNKVIANKDATATTLAAQNIMAAFGQGNDKNLYAYVRACLAEASVLDNALLVPPNYGWQVDGSFACNDNIYYQNGKSHTFVSNRLSNLINVTKPHGELDEWVSVMRMLMRKGMWGHIACMALSFGSALQRFTPAGSRAFTFHIASKETGIGKTLALAVSNSVWGDPVTFAIKPKTSENTMLQRAGMLGSLPLNIDEVTNKVRAGDKEWLPNHIFDFSQGGHKLKGMGAANAEMRDDLHWESNSILTSNAPMLEAMMGARETSSNGEAYRMLEWLGGKEELVWTAEEEEIKDRLRSNYGVAGPIWAQWLATNQTTAQAGTVEALKKWKEHVYAPDKERFWTGGVGTAIAALTLVGPRYANIIEVPIGQLTDFFKRRVQEARRIINTNRQYSTDILNAFIRENHGGFVKLAAPSSTIAIFSDGREVRHDSTRSAIRGRIEYDAAPGWTDFFVEVRVIKEYCAKRNKSYIEFLQEMQAKGSVTEVRKDLLAKTKSTPLRVLCLKISQPNDSVE